MCQYLDEFNVKNICKKNVNENVQKFWNLESIEIKENNKSMYQDLLDEICINKGGRYEVILPFKISHPVLPKTFLC